MSPFSFLCSSRTWSIVRKHQPRIFYIPNNGVLGFNSLFICIIMIFHILKGKPFTKAQGTKAAGWKPSYKCKVKQYFINMTIKWTRSIWSEWDKPKLLKTKLKRVFLNHNINYVAKLWNSGNFARGKIFHHHGGL